MSDPKSQDYFGQTQGPQWASRVGFLWGDGWHRADTRTRAERTRAGRDEQVCLSVAVHEDLLATVVGAAQGPRARPGSGGARGQSMFLSGSRNYFRSKKDQHQKHIKERRKEGRKKGRKEDRSFLTPADAKLEMIL